jgi:hypothetical protein
VDAGITAGCASDSFCPMTVVTRAQMAVIAQRALHGSEFPPPLASGVVFNDVAVSDSAAPYIEHLFADGIITGCGNGNYCPQAAVTRDQMARLLLRLKYYGSEFNPDPASGLFDDVPITHWAAEWIEALAGEGVTVGCDADNYCPSQAVTRHQLAVLLVRALQL